MPHLEQLEVNTLYRVMSAILLQGKGVASAAVVFFLGHLEAGTGPAAFLCSARLARPRRRPQGTWLWGGSVARCHVASSTPSRVFRSTFWTAV